METYNSIEVTKQLVKDGKISQEIAEAIFPELKSEDEEMIEIIRGAIFTATMDETTRRDALAWLEKQGEQNPKFADFIPTDCTSDAKNENRWHKVEDSLPDNAREVLCKDAIGNLFIGRYYNDGDYWEVSMYDEPDKSNKDNPPVIMWVNIPSSEQNLANSTKTCKDEQNPAWSEKDEYILEIITSVLQVNFEPNERFSGYEEYMNVDLINWLKSLKERYTWKPSDEQMEYLAKAITTLGNEGDNKTSAILCELRAGLKKLKG